MSKLDEFAEISDTANSVCHSIGSFHPLSTSGVKLLSVVNGKGGTEVFSVDKAGNVTAAGNINGTLAGTIDLATQVVGVLPVASGGTASSTALANSKVMVSSAGKIVESSTTTTNLGSLDTTTSLTAQLAAKSPSASPTFSGTITTPLTASRALATGSANELAVSATTATELGYVSGVTSAIQTQLGTKAARPTMTSAALGSNFTVTGGTFSDITGLVVTVTTPAAGEVITLALRGSGIDAGSSGTMVLAYNVNGGSDVIIGLVSLAVSFGYLINFSFPVSLSSGSNTLQLRGRISSGGNQAIQGNSTFGFTTLYAIQYG
jgi:hypothetical protein